MRAQMNPVTIAAVWFLAGHLAAAAPILRFATHFEPSSQVVDESGNPAHFSSASRDIYGADTSLPSGMPTAWGGRGKLGLDPRLGSFNILLNTTGDTGGHVSLINDPTNSGRGKVMQFWLQYGNEIKGRVQTNVYGSAADLNEVTSIVKVYFHPDMGVLRQLPNEMGWLTIQELWTSPVWSAPEGTNFRITLGLYKPSGTVDHLSWHVKSDEAGSGGIDYWSFNTHAQARWVPLGEWMTLVTYYKKGTDSTGRFKTKIIRANGSSQEIFNVNDWTYHPTDSNQNTGLTHHNPHKMYTSLTIVDWVREHAPSKAMIIYWDDWRYYEGDAYTNIPPDNDSFPATVQRANQETDMRLSIFPNPFNPSASVRFTLPAPSAVNIEIYDSQGKLMGCAVQSTYGAGSHTAAWNGRNELGRPLSGGVYIVKMRAGGKVLHARGLMLK